MQLNEKFYRTNQVNVLLPGFAQNVVELLKELLKKFPQELGEVLG